MKNFIKEYWGWILYIYLIASIVAFIIRFHAMDCQYRYADYLFPLSKLHCEVK